MNDGWGIARRSDQRGKSSDSYSFLVKYHALDSNSVSNLWAKHTSLDNKVESLAWVISEKPRWNDYKKKIISYEASYGMKTAQFISDYKQGKLKSLPREQVEDWVRAYSLYWN